MLILGIESSCDDTAVAIYDDVHGLLAHEIFSQISLHALYGGVVPELASREHLTRLLPLVARALQVAQVDSHAIDGIAYTAGPGLIGSLLVGASFAKGLAMAWQKTLIPVNHLEAHLLAAGLEVVKPDFPFAVLLVSGGHTLIAYAKALGSYEILGETLDDAVGEAFDKTAKMMGLPYPGGPLLSELAKTGDASAFRLTRPMINRPGLDFSFSGLKTQVLTAWEASDQSDTTRANLAAAFQQTVSDTLLIKIERARDVVRFKQLVVAGGVSANWQIRERMEAWGATKNVDVFFPRREFCTDNAAMVAYTGCMRMLAGMVAESALFVKARWPIDTLT